MKCMPFTYLVTAFREVFISDGIVFTNHGMFTIIFWVITFVMFIWGIQYSKEQKKILQMFYRTLIQQVFKSINKEGRKSYIK